MSGGKSRDRHVRRGMNGISQNQRGRARAMRREPTDAERRLWRLLRDRRLSGHKFRRQVPVGPYIVDFLCVGAS